MKYILIYQPREAPKINAIINPIKKIKNNIRAIPLIINETFENPKIPAKKAINKNINVQISTIYPLIASLVAKTAKQLNNVAKIVSITTLNSGES